MSRARKLLERFLSQPADFSFDELKRLLASLGYREEKLGRTSGSRTAFLNEDTKHIIRIHEPHPKPVLKLYQIRHIVDELRGTGVL